jgi:uncharacterized protein (UPF0548 family)
VLAQHQSNFSYAEIGATATTPPRPYNIDQNRVQLGTGEIAWKRAVQAVRTWQMFSFPWLQIFWPTAPIEVGTEVAVCVRALGLYFLNACRIVYVIAEDGPVKRFGFAYGTLKEHAQSGEERFCVEWNTEDDSVRYEILAFSRPHQVLAKLGHPIARNLQKRFARDSKGAMLRAVNGA